MNKKIFDKIINYNTIIIILDYYNICGVYCHH